MNRVYIVTYRKAPEYDWPVDVGDDPAFCASAEHEAKGGLLSWGVCRPDVRNGLQPGDLVIFFAADHLTERCPARYYFVGFAVVNHKIAQSDIWEKPEYTIYQEYHNLLIRPCQDGYEHFEPPPNKALWHRNWAHRIVDRRSATKVEIENLCASGRILKAGVQPGSAPHIGANYVLFRPESYETYVLAEPPLVAKVSVSPGLECWERDPIADSIKRLVLGDGHRQLRTRNAQQPHRHIAIRNVDAAAWVEELHHLCDEYGLERRARIAKPLSTLSSKTVSNPCA